MINLANRIGAFSFAEWGQIVAVRQMNASFLRRFVVWVFACKREFQTDPTQAFIDVHDRELDFFESFLYQDKKDSPRGGERYPQLRLGAWTMPYVRLLFANRTYAHIASDAEE